MTKTRGVADLARIMSAAAGAGVPAATLDSSGARSAWWLSTGNTALDRLCGDEVNYGIGGGRMYTMRGMSQTGKTLACLCAGRAVAVAGGVVVYVDMERVLGSDVAQRAGIDPAMMIKMPSQAQVEALIAKGRTFTLEDAFDALGTFCIEARKLYPDVPVLILYDSIAESPTIKSDEAEWGRKGAYGDLAKALSQGWRQLRPLLCDLQVASLWVNQERINQQQTYGDPGYQPGGMAAEHYPDSILRFKRAGFVPENEKIKSSPAIGEVFSAQVVKSRIRPGRPSAKFRVFYDTGIDDCWSVVQMADDFGILQKSGNWIIAPNGVKVNGREKFTEAVRQDVGLYQDLRQHVLAYRNDGDYSFEERPQPVPLVGEGGAA